MKLFLHSSPSVIIKFVCPSRILVKQCFFLPSHLFVRSWTLSRCYNLVDWESIRKIVLTCVLWSIRCSSVGVHRHDVLIPSSFAFFSMVHDHCNASHNSVFVSVQSMLSSHRLFALGLRRRRRRRFCLFVRSFVRPFVRSFVWLDTRPQKSCEFIYTPYWPVG